MNKAYDAVFQIEVDADVIAKTSYQTIGDRFRYQCLCCGEEVYLAATDSIIKAPHFRHRRGNNDTDCESYLGQPGALEHYVSIRKHNKEHIAFGFNIEHMTFEFSIMFEPEAIESYAMNTKRLSLYVKYYSQPFFTVPIKRENFTPNSANYFALSDYSNDYYISVELDSFKVKYSDIIKRDGRLNIYRVNHSNSHYKRNASDVLYTKCSYLAVSENEGYVYELIDLQNIEAEGDVFSFITQGRKFYAVKFVILYADFPSRTYFQQHELKVENSEILTVLWPPVFMRNMISVCETDKAYISSSFELIPHGNVDSNDIGIQNMCDEVYEVSFIDQVTIYEKNVECRIIKEKLVIGEEVCELPLITYIEKYTIPDTYNYYMFDKNGCTRLAIGSKVYVSGGDRIVGYKNGHIKAIVLASPEEMPDKKQLINDIIKYHPQSEPFEPDDFMDIKADEAALSYMENCYRSGQINTVVKQYIKEGLI